MQMAGGSQACESAFWHGAMRRLWRSADGRMLAVVILTGGLLLASYGVACLVSWLLGGPALSVLHFLVDPRDWNPGWQGWVGLAVGLLVFTVGNWFLEERY